MSDSDEQQREAEFEAWNDSTKGGTVHSTESGERNYYDDLLGRGDGDGDAYPACERCGAQPMTANCNNAGCDVPKHYAKRYVEHHTEPENALWADMLSDTDLPNEIIKEDIY